MVLFGHNLPQPTQAQLMRGEFPGTLRIEQGVVLSCRFAESKVRWTSRVLWMAVVSQSSVKSSRRNSASSSVGSKPFSNKSSPKSQPALFRKKSLPNKIAYRHAKAKSRLCP